MTTKSYQYVDSPLHTLYSCRLRFTEEQREILKAAHNKLRRAAAVAPPKAVLSNSSIQVQDNTEGQVDGYKQFGMSALIVADLIASRDSVSLPVVVKLQKLLGVEVITEESLHEQFSQYLDYVLRVMD